MVDRGDVLTSLLGTCSPDCLAPCRTSVSINASFKIRSGNKGQRGLVNERVINKVGGSQRSVTVNTRGKNTESREGGGCGETATFIGCYGMNGSPENGADDVMCDRIGCLFATKNTAGPIYVMHTDRRRPTIGDRLQPAEC